MDRTSALPTNPFSIMIAYAAFEGMLFAVRRAPPRGWLLISVTVSLIAAATIWQASLSAVAPMVGENIAAGGLARLFPHQTIGRGFVIVL